MAIPPTVNVYPMKWSPCYPYTTSNVRTFAPSTTGLYRLLIRNRIFYIGQSKDLRKRLLEHLHRREGNRCIKRHLLTYSCFFRFAVLEPCSALLQAERDHIRKYNPPCNIDIRTIEERLRTSWRCRDC